MVKGCQRRIIQIKDTGSNLFTEAYFVLSETAHRREEADIVAEATRLLEQSTENSPRPKGGLFCALLGFLSGVVACGGGVALLFWLW